MDLLKVALVSLLSIAALFMIAKFMGHKQISQLDFFDYITGITIGSIAAEMATELENPERDLIAMVVYGAVSVLLSFITDKLPRTRKYINGTPTILYNEGKLYRSNIKKAKLDLSEFLMMCREQGYFELADIQTATLEHNGRLSILPSSASRPLTPSDMKITVSPQKISAEVIMDGRIMGENLTRMRIDEKWLQSSLRSQGYKSEKDVFLALCSEDLKLTVYGYDS